MIVVVIVVLTVLALVALVLLVVALITRRRLIEQRRLTHEALDRSTALAGELAGTQSALTAVQSELAAVQSARAAAESEVEQLRRATVLDPDLLWCLERSRSERTWRMSVAPSPEVRSALADAPDPLVEALQIELAAAREEVGTVVTLDAELRAPTTAAGALLTLRVAQELLATVVRRAEETVLRVRADGDDVVITVEATDENGDRVAVEALDLPASDHVVQTELGAVVRGVVLPD